MTPHKETAMRTYDVTISRTVTALQEARVTVRAESEDEAVEEAWDTDPIWTNRKVFDSDNHETDVVEIPECP